jgi:hypothetical protein
MYLLCISSFSPSKVNLFDSDIDSERASGITANVRPPVKIVDFHDEGFYWRSAVYKLMTKTHSEINFFYSNLHPILNNKKFQILKIMISPFSERNAVFE